MERHLMVYCINYNSEPCHQEIKNATRPGKIINGKFPFFPSGKELMELDKICEKCESRYFKITEYICPACRSKEFQDAVEAGTISEGNNIKAKVIIMKCAECKSRLKLVEQF
jgi:hypothetical protein